MSRSHPLESSHNFSYTSIYFQSMSCTESLLQSSALKQLLVKNFVEHDDSHSVWKVAMNRLSPVWHLLSFGIIPDPTAFSPASCSGAPACPLCKFLYFFIFSTMGKSSTWPLWGEYQAQLVVPRREKQMLLRYSWCPK